MYIHVKVKTGQKHEAVQKIDDCHFEIDLKQDAKRNEANRRVIEILRNIYKEALEIKIITGHHFSSKLIFVTTPEDLSA